MLLIARHDLPLLLLCELIQHERRGHISACILATCSITAQNCLIKVHVEQAEHFTLCDAAVTILFDQNGLVIVDWID